MHGMRESACFEARHQKARLKHATPSACDVHVKGLPGMQLVEKGEQQAKQRRMTALRARSTSAGWECLLTMPPALAIPPKQYRADELRRRPLRRRRACRP